MSIDLRKFVDINIQEHVESIVSGTRNETALFTARGSSGTVRVISNMVEANSFYSSDTGATRLLAFIETYFDHGGSKLRVYEGYNDVDVSAIKNLPDECINVAFADLSYSSIKSLAESMNADSSIYGIKEKILFASTTDATDNSVIKNFAVKYSSEVGAEMTMCAYLSQIDVYGTNTVFDYAFTQETIPAATVTDTDFDRLMTNNINVDVYLAGATRVCGGNCKDGAELTNNFVRIVLHQTLTTRLLRLLTQKITSTNGLGKIYTTIIQELTHYLDCGYLTTDKVWLDNDLVVTANAKSYTIIEKGTPLLNGYALKVLPMSSLTEQDRALHKAPAVYLIVADQYGIRKITINGEVI